MTRQPLWTKQRVAEYLGCSVRRVSQLVRDRKVSFIQDGGRKKFRESDIAAYVAARSVSHRPALSSPARTI